jgi:hypothetical protein
MISMKERSCELWGYKRQHMLLPAMLRELFSDPEREILKVR